MISQEKLKGDLGEEAVNTLAFDTYLKYWCYAGPKDEKGSMKEICDLLILFRDTMIILSVKNYGFKGNYDRYFRSTLDKAVSQVAGAERRLADNSRELFIRHANLGEMKFDSDKYKIIHRIIVNHNTVPLFYPGGRLTSTGKYVHIFNWDAFLCVVEELDTIPDFIQYLTERELIFNDKKTIIMNGTEDAWDLDVQRSFYDYNTAQLDSGPNFLLISGTENDLLADYLWHDRKFNKHFYDTTFNGGSFQLDGKWQDYLSQKEVQCKKFADFTSYFVDEFLKNEVLYKQDPSNLELAVELLSLSRFERRIVGSQFLSMLTQYKDLDKDNIVRRYGKAGDLVIAFVLYSRNIPRGRMVLLSQIAAEGYAYWNRYQDKKIAIIGFSQDGIGFVFGLLNVEPFSAEREEITRLNLNDLKWFTNSETFMVNHKEYPD